MQTIDLDTFTINTLPNMAIYEELETEGRINDNELYLIDGENNTYGINFLNYAESRGVLPNSQALIQCIADNLDRTIVLPAGNYNFGDMSIPANSHFRLIGEGTGKTNISGNIRVYSNVSDNLIYGGISDLTISGANNASHPYALKCENLTCFDIENVEVTRVPSGGYGIWLMADASHESHELRCDNLRLTNAITGNSGLRLEKVYDALFSNCIISDWNHQLNQVVYVSGGGGNCFDNCHFWGGKKIMDYSSTTTVFTNCYFDSPGGGTGNTSVISLGTYGQVTNTSFVNCIFAASTDYPYSSVIDYRNESIWSTKISFTNCIFNTPTSAANKIFIGTDYIDYVYFSNCVFSERNDSGTAMFTFGNTRNFISGSSPLQNFVEQLSPTDISVIRGDDGLENRFCRNGTLYLSVSGSSTEAVDILILPLGGSSWTSIYYEYLGANARTFAINYSAGYKIRVITNLQIDRCYFVANA